MAGVKLGMKDKHRTVCLNLVPDGKGGNRKLIPKKKESLINICPLSTY